MTAAERAEPLDWEVYLRGEERAVRRHEYVFGRVYAMPDAKNRHSVISANTLAALGSRLRGTSCRASGSDQKVRISTDGGFCFFYPDVTVDCEPLQPDLVYTDTPKVIVETLSTSTRRIDEGEKRDLYLKLPSLAVYVMIDSDRPAAVVWRRVGSSFQREVYVQSSETIPLPEIGAALPLAEVYANVVWSKVNEEEEEEA